MYCKHSNVFHWSRFWTFPFYLPETYLQLKNKTFAIMSRARRYFHQVIGVNIIKHDFTAKVPRKREKGNCPNDLGSRRKEQYVSRHVSFLRAITITIYLSDSFLRIGILKFEPCIFTYGQTMNETTVKNEIKKPTNFRIIQIIKVVRFTLCSRKTVFRFCENQREVKLYDA